MQMAPPGRARAHVTKLCFAGTRLGAADHRALARVLHDSTEITHLELEATEASVYNMCQLARAIGACRTLTRLQITHQDVVAETFEALGAALREFTSLTALDIEDCERVSPTGMAAFATHLCSDTPLRHLKLSLCGLDANDMRSLARVLSATTRITSLDLGNGDHIGDDGAELLCAGMALNAQIVQLSLYGTCMTARGAHAVAAMLRTNRSLQNLVLTDNSIGDAGAESIALALRDNLSLTRLSLDGNDIGNVGAIAIAQALATNRALVSLFVGYNDDITDAGKAALDRACSTSQSLQRVEWYEDGFHFE